MDSPADKKQGYSFRLVNIDCLRTSTDFNVVMELEESIEDLLPYLASILPGCNYVHGSGVIDLMDGGHIVGIYSDRITITSVRSREEAALLCSIYFDKILQVRADRNSIQPVYAARPTLTLLDILRALPKTNCGACQSPTCIAFAARVFRREAPVSLCPSFLEQREKHTALLEKMASYGYPVS